VWGEVSAGQDGGAVLLDAYDRSARPGNEPSHVHSVWRVADVPFRALGGAPQKLHRPLTALPRCAWGEAHGGTCARLRTYWVVLRVSRVSRNFWSVSGPRTAVDRRIQPYVRHHEGEPAH
jgi:hypothetical protein